MYNITAQLHSVTSPLTVRFFTLVINDIQLNVLTRSSDNPANNRKKLASSEPKLVANLILLMDSPSLKVQCQAALALRNLASDGM
jgi:vacuolar protein 8